MMTNFVQYKSPLRFGLQMIQEKRVSRIGIGVNHVVLLTVEDSFYRWHTWQIVGANVQYIIDKEEAKISWIDVLMKPKSKSRITYTVLYTNIQNINLA